MAYNQNYSQRSNDEVHFDLMEHIGVLGRKDNGWTKEVNIVAWNGGKAKVDIRDWGPDHDRMSRGITLFEEEAENLVKALAHRYGLRYTNKMTESTAPANRTQESAAPTGTPEHAAAAPSNAEMPASAPEAEEGTAPPAAEEPARNE